MLRLFTRFLEKKAHSDYDQLLIDRIEKIAKHEPIFWNVDSQIYAKLNELNGYKYLSLTITGFLNINTTEGCSLTFYTDTNEFSITSESPDIAGEYSEISKIGLTKFDVDIEPNWIDFIDTSNIINTKLTTKNGQFPKTNLEFNYDGLNIALLRKTLTPQ